MLLCLSLYHAAWGQKPADYGFEQVSNVPSTTVYDILIDRRGYVWLAHELGISRYNGLSFATFYHPLQSSLGADNLIEDSSGRIWYRNFNGQIFYIEDGHVRKLETSLPDAFFHPFIIVGDELLTRTGDHLLIYNIRTGQHHTLATSADNIALNEVTNLYQAGDKAFLIALINNRSRIIKYEKGTFTLVKHYTLQHPYAHRIIYANEDSIIVITLKDKQSILSTLNVDNGMRSEGLASASQDYNNYLWSNTDSGAVWIHTRRKSYILGNKEGIDNLSLTDIVTDREGNTWASSMTYGLMIKRKKSGWRLLSEYSADNSFTKLGLLDSTVAGITYSGKVVYMDKSVFPSGGAPKAKNGSISFFDTENNFYLYYSDYFKTGTSSQHIKEAGALKDACYIDRNTLVLGTNSGLLAFTGNDQALPGIISAHFEQSKPGHYNYTPGRRVRSIAYEPKNKILYAGFSHGLYQYTAHSITEVRFNELPIYAYHLKAYGDKIYVATHNNGILLLQNGRVVQSIGPDSGLASATVFRLKIFNNHLWIKELDKIQVYDLEREKFITNISLPPVKASQVYDLLEVNGKAYFSTIGGLYEIPLNRSVETEAPPLNYISSVIVNGTDTLREGAILPWQQNNIQFSLDGLYYFDSERLFFNYRLLGPGNDTNWNATIPGQNKILLSYLSPGKYTFEAIARTPDGLTAEKPVSFSFTINKPLWLQTWFILSVTFLFAGTVIIYTRSRINARRKANQIVIEKLRHEKALNESELKALKSQMNPHFIFNSLNTIQEMFMWGDKNAANEQMGNFATLTRLILTVSEKRSIPLSTEVDILKKYLELEKMRFQETFDYEIIMDEDVDEGYIHIPPMIIQPFVENSIKHGLLHKEGEKKLSIIFQLVPGDEYITCIIRDNGIGRKKAEEIRDAANYSYCSFSTEATKKRLQLIHDNINNQILLTYTDLKDETGAATGTSVRIMIPTFV